MTLGQDLLQWTQLLILFWFLIAVEVSYYVIVTFCQVFPFPSLLDYIYTHSKRVRDVFSTPLRWTSRSKSGEYEWRSAADLIRENGYRVEEHTVETKDGFVLVMQRIAGGKRHEQSEGNGRRPAVLLMHGLLQNSESFLMKGSSLGFFLADAGYDVWLGNNRGNRYSHKHIHYRPSQEKYWNYSIDELARYDVPAMIEYILDITNSRQLSYVGFSQGTAQAFAAFSHSPKLASRVNVFVALSPAARCRGLSKSLLSTLVESNLKFIYLIFGRKAMFSIVTFVQPILSRRMFAKLCDLSMRYLFKWDNSLVSEERKPELYSHIYDTASVKCVEHWFQLMRTGCLSMYEDESPRYGQVPVKYDLSKITCPIALFYGLKDTVIEVPDLISQLPDTTFVHMEPEFEHLDFIWADTISSKVYPSLLAELERFNPQPGKDYLVQRPAVAYCVRETTDLTTRSEPGQAITAIAG